MPIRTSCPRCQTTYTLADDRAGKTVRCRQCDRPFVVESPAEGDADNEAAALQEKPRPAARRAPVLPAADEDEGPRSHRRSRDDEDEDRPPRRRKKGGSLVLPLVAGGVVAVLLLMVACGGVVWWVLPRAATELGTWPDPGQLRGPMGAPGADQTVTLHIAGVADQNTRQAIEDKLPGRMALSTATPVSD
jgi:hypothetical protein